LRTSHIAGVACRIPTCASDIASSVTTSCVSCVCDTSRGGRQLPDAKPAPSMATSGRPTEKRGAFRRELAVPTPFQPAPLAAVSRMPRERISMSWLPTIYRRSITSTAGASKRSRTLRACWSVAAPYRPFGGLPKGPSFSWPAQRRGGVYQIHARESQGIQQVLAVARVEDALPDAVALGLVLTVRERLSCRQKT
jgi:hypothetical protein